MSAGSPALEILASRVADHRLELQWTGGAWSYEVLAAADLAAPQWRLVLTTAADRAVIPVSGQQAFFRVAARAERPPAVRFSLTNELSGDAASFSSRPVAGRDAVYDGPANLGGFDLHQLVVAAPTRAGYALWFDGDGGFQVMTNGVAAGHSGRYAVSPGAGPNELTYVGTLTNQNGRFAFSVTLTGPGRSPGLQGGAPRSAGGPAAGDTGNALEGLIGGAAWLWCLPGFAAQQLGCAAACANQAVACAFQWPPRASYCNWITTITWPLGAQTPECVSRCEHGCK